MNKDFKQRWVDALRSGNYRQGKARLRSVENNFCCLGVLCDIYDPNGWGGVDGVSIRYNYESDRDFPTWAIGTLPAAICESLEIDDSSAGKLADMNDRGIGFEEISDWILENL